jgi:hypothetical protein
VFLLRGRSTLAARIEKTLFLQDFQVQHLSGGEVSLEALRDIVRFAQRAGIILLYSGDALDSDMTRLLVQKLQAQFFDLNSSSAAASDEETAQQALAIANSLRLTSNGSVKKEVN